MENRLKEQQLDLFADRTSTQTFQNNQLKLWFSFGSVFEVMEMGLMVDAIASPVLFEEEDTGVVELV